MQEANFDVIIFGSGPAGSTAAIYTARAMLKTLVIAGNPPGGQLTITSEVENFPGFPEGIGGSELINKLFTQAQKFGATFVNENVVSISGSFENSFNVKTNLGTEYKAKSIIIATGASAKWLGLDNETRLMGKGVSACATCDGFFFKNKNIVVVGAGDAAMEEATYLTKFANKITVLVRGEKDKMRASKFMIEKAFNNPKIEFKFNSTVEDVLGETSVKGLKVKDVVSGEVTTLSDVEGLFVAIGHEPNTKFLIGFIDLDEKGYVKINDGTKASIEGIFVAGDVGDHKYRQAITASAFGCMAAIDTTKFLSEHGVETKQISY